MLRTTLLLTVSALLLFFVGCEPSGSDATIYLFDMGQAESPLSTHYQTITETDTYSPEKGFGWNNQPETAVYDENSTPKLPLYQDGVLISQTTPFQADLPTGEYFVNVVLGFEKDSAKVEVEIAGEESVVELPWRRIKHQTISQKISHTENTLTINFTPISGSIIVKGIEIIPQVGKSSIPFATELELDTTSVSKFAEKLEEKLAKNPKNAQALTQWVSCSKYLQAANYYELGWWSWAVEQTDMSIFPRYDMVSDLLKQIIQDEKDPLVDRSTYLLGKTHYWLYQEQEFAFDKEEYPKYFESLKQSYANHETLKMYLGEKIAYESDCQINDANAPKWAILQREAMCRMQGIIHYWVTEKQAANGELGGKFGDDVEILRWWLPAILGADDSLARLGYTRLADGVWNSGKLFRAYSKKLEDVEHAAELFRDTHSAIQLIQYGEPRFVERGMMSMRNFRDTWSGKTNRGHLHLRSSHFSATKVLEEAPYGVDIPMNSRATLAGLWTGWYNHNPEILSLFSQWGKAWVEDADRTDNGKPKGLLPAAISFSNEKIGGYGDNWYHPNLGWSYYKWEQLGGATEMYNQLLGMYQITKNPMFLKPIKQTIDLAINTADASDEEKQKEGSAAWAGTFLRGEQNPEANHLQDGIKMFNLARTVTGWQEYDEFLTKVGSPYIAYQATGDISHIENELESALGSLRYNLPLSTSEVKFTDRVYVDGEELLFGMYTGYAGRGIEAPALAVSWENTGLDVGVLVNYAQEDSMNINLYNFGKKKKIFMNCWKLTPGIYSMTLKNKDGFTVGDRTLIITERGQKEQIELPDNQELTLTVSQREKINTNTSTAPDLAIGIGDVGITPKPISGSDSVDLNVIIHNIGNADAKNITVKTWVDGKPLGSRKIDMIAAPNDLRAKTHRIRIAWQNKKGAHDFLVSVSCDQQEITLKNNQFTMHMEEVVLHGR